MQYRLGDGAKDGGASVYVLARDDLMRWYHVDGLSGLQLTDKYRSVHGVYAHPTPLSKWLKAPAQALVCLDNNEDHYLFVFAMCRVVDSFCRYPVCTVCVWECRCQGR